MLSLCKDSYDQYWFICKQDLRLQDIWHRLMVILIYPKKFFVWRGFTTNNEMLKL